MSIKSFLKLVEIQTKAASITPFLLGTVYALYHFESFNVTNFLYMLISLLCIDMATTTINNYIDYKKAIKKEGYGYESHNAIVRDNLKESTVVVTIFILIIIATVFGILLAINTNVVVLLLGALSFAVGILYSFGPVPISRTPFGEIFSGGFMGFIIPFIAAYIHNQSMIDVTFVNSTLSIDMEIVEVLKVLLISIPAVVGIANIMLANNICDIEDDIENKRYTLPIYIGKKNALSLFKVLYYIGFVSIILALGLGVLPLVSVVTVLTFIIVQKHIKIFDRNQSKKETFELSVKNFLIQNALLIVTIGIGYLTQLV
ncbi:1,4-dihydroxy-2-naphthoate polyprenyltransferase [Haloplasma contractile]|uniref:14-dihydroxy-2-naphthoate octaprenyltransferase protein n=1 Tax=Haloplasma contractile SSD-17B TaxID=1033810 RepID=F7Q1Y2_9MOLU|nr:1,4-dihydroxy-2-naphthoate polyprenyltransferase [Haloplasma contractile]ERJ12206.1 14-dihydroxy-2-naphthoate octaprenyltransferase protein [Haloplasma contractile SSD-17B]